MLLDFVDVATWLMKFTLNLDLKSLFKSLTISLVKFWRTADVFPSKSCKKAFLRYALVLIGNFDNVFLYIGFLRHHSQSVGECLSFLTCSRLVQESVENIDKTDFLAAKSFFPNGICRQMPCDCCYHFCNSQGNVLWVFRIAFYSYFLAKPFDYPPIGFQNRW